MLGVLVFAGLARGQESGGLYGPRIIHGFEPAYPPEALAAARLGGTIHLFVEVDASGYVLNVEAFGPWLTCGQPNPHAEEL